MGKSDRKPEGPLKKEYRIELHSKKLNLFFTILTLLFVVGFLVGITLTKGVLAALPLLAVIIAIVVIAKLVDKR